METKEQQIKILPHSIDAEQAILGSLLLSKVDKLYDVLEIVTVDDFYKQSHQQIFSAILKLEHKNVEIDLITVADELKDFGSENFDYLAELAKNSPSSANVKHYANIVKRNSIARSLLLVTQEIQDLITSKDLDTEELFEIADQKIFSAMEQHFEKNERFEKPEVILAKVMEELDVRMESGSRIRGVASGFTELDNMTSGFEKGSLNIIAARPAMGKTTFALNIADAIAQNSEHPVLFFTIEMSNEQLMERLLSSRSNINFGDIRTGNISDAQLGKLSSFSGQMMKTNILFRSGSVGVAEIKREARKIFRKHGGLKAIFIDYIQLMKTSQRAENRTLAIAEISRSLKELAVDLGIPIIALSQLNRSLEQRPDKRPVLSDLRDSGGLEQDPDLIMFIYRDIVYNPESAAGKLAEIIIGKQRNGPIGNITLNFVPELSKFENYVKANNFI